MCQIWPATIEDDDLIEVHEAESEICLRDFDDHDKDFVVRPILKKCNCNFPE